MYTDSRHYREYEQMLVDLHTMIAEGTGDSDKAMDLRGQMEGAEAHFTELQRARLNALSGDLSMLHGREIPDAAVVARTPSADLPLLLARAYAHEDWEEVLTLLRADVSAFLNSYQLAYMRARAYAALGEFAPAIALMDEAARREPANPNFGALAMELLWTDQRYDEAYGRAKAYLNDAAAPDRLVLIAGGILSRLRKRDQQPGDLMPIIRGSLDRIEGALAGETSPEIRFEGLATLGLLRAEAGEAAQAVATLKRALDEGRAEVHFATRGLIMREMELVSSGRSQSPEARRLSSELANVVAPRVKEHYSLAA